VCVIQKNNTSRAQTAPTGSQKPSAAGQALFNDQSASSDAVNSKGAQDGEGVASEEMAKAATMASKAEAERVKAQLLDALEGVQCALKAQMEVIFKGQRVVIRESTRASTHI
jgi:hypothetical protein